MTAEKILSIAQAEIGTSESPPGSNRIKYNTWYYGQEVSGKAYPWCMVFIQWCFAQAEVSELLPLRTASCGALMRAAQAAGLWITKDFRPGDVVIYDFPGGGPTDHCGIVESFAKGKIVSIEGNTGAGNDANGGQVQRRTRDITLAVGAVRPQYEQEYKPDNTPAPAHREGVEWALEHGILLGNAQGDLMLSQPLTRQQFCTRLFRFFRWSLEEGKE